MLTLDNKAFDALLVSPGLFVIDFSSKHCGPCRAMVPTIEALAREYQGRVEFFAVDVDDEPQLAQRYLVRSMPTFVVLRVGAGGRSPLVAREVGRIIGARPRAFVAGVIDRALAGDVAIAAP